MSSSLLTILSQVHGFKFTLSQMQADMRDVALRRAKIDILGR